MTSSFCIFFNAVNVDFRPDVPRAATEDVPQLRCVGSECGVLTGWVSLLARCDLTVVKLAGRVLLVSQWAKRIKWKEHREEHWLTSPVKQDELLFNQHCFISLCRFTGGQPNRPCVSVILELNISVSTGLSKKKYTVNIIIIFCLSLIENHSYSWKVLFTERCLNAIGNGGQGCKVQWKRA